MTRRHEGTPAAPLSSVIVRRHVLLGAAMLISEIYPVKIRGQAMSVATMANWGANFVVTISFLTLLSAIGNAGTFFLFAGLSIVALAYFQRQVPETKSRSLQDIERDLDLPGGRDNEDPRLVGRTGL
jgi:hypothetical protein